MKILIYVKANEHPVVKQTLKKLNDEMFGFINQVIPDSGIEYQSNNKDLTEFISLDIEDTNITVTRLNEMILHIEAFLIKEYAFTDVYYKLK